MGDSATHRTFAVVRPYSSRIRERVFHFLARHGFHPVGDEAVERGTSDATAAVRASTVEVDLLLVPFNLHRDEAGRMVDGVGVLTQAEFVDRKLPILMPVSDTSFFASFQRRFEVLLRQRPEVARRVIVLRESQIGSRRVAERLARLRPGG